MLRQWGILAVAMIELQVNGQARRVEADGGVSLLEVLREYLGLTGAKYGCGEAQCGACVVLLDGRPVPACVTTVGEAAGRAVTTVEGLATGETLHPVQDAFIAEDALQCGYCTPGMVVAAVGLLRERPTPTEAEIRAALQPHLCRCGAYNRIVRAVQRAAQAMAATPPVAGATASIAGAQRG